MEFYYREFTWYTIECLRHVLFAIMRMTDGGDFKKRSFIELSVGQIETCVANTKPNENKVKNPANFNQLFLILINI